MARRKRGGLIALLAGVAVVAAAVVGALAMNAGSRTGAVVKVTIPKGATFAEAADSLGAAHVFRSATLFRLSATVQGQSARSITPGRYLVARGASVAEIVAQLESGRGQFRRITIPEGWAIQQIARLMSDSLGIATDSTFLATRDSVRRARIKTTAGDVEGYLFPATYEFAAGTNAGGVIDTMLLTFERRWKSSWIRRCSAKGARVMPQ